MHNYTQEILDLCISLVKEESTKENKEGRARVLDIASDFLHEFHIERLKDDDTESLLIYNQETRPERFTVILNGHLDVVPGTPQQFVPRMQDGKLLGRGVHDMKGGAAAAMVIFKEIARELSYPIALQLVTDEEIGGFHGTGYQVAQGISGEFIIAAEPTNFLISNKAKGIVWLRVTFTGLSAHSAYLWDGENAVEKMHAFLSEIWKRYPIPRKEEWRTTVNVSCSSTKNTAYNKVPDTCEIAMDIRYIPHPTITPDIIIEEIKSLAPKGADVHIALNEPAQYTQETNEYITKLASSIREHTGRNAQLGNEHWGSDVRFYTARGVPAVTFGPVGGGLHTDNEWLDTTSLDPYAHIIKSFLMNM